MFWNGKAKYLANGISLLRIGLSVPLLLISVPSTIFYFFYTSAIISDFVDGFIARKTGATSQFGARLDTVADAMLFVVLAARVIPLSSFPLWLWMWVSGIAVLRVFSATTLKIRFGHFALLHTYGNKLTGILVAALPLLIGLPQGFFGFAIFACIIATLSAIEELFMVLRSSSFNPDIVGLLILRSKKRFQDNVNKVEVT